MSARGGFQGVAAVVRFNWPFYLAALCVLVGSVVGLVFISLPWLQAVMVLAAAGCLYFILVSLGVSHWVYDRSDLFRWEWLGKALPKEAPERIVFCHSGFDESSGMLVERFRAAEFRILDHHDARWMSEPSIMRARRLFPPVEGTLPAPFGEWPVADGWADVVLGILAIHELRETGERSDWFREARRCLRADGSIVIVEHMRDPANFLAFGPGFLHFHSIKAWRKSWEDAGLTLDGDFRISPFLRVFVLKDNE